MTDDVRLERRGPVGLLTLDRQKALNALDLGMIRAIHPQLADWARDPEVKAVVIRGAGGKAFCAGGDVRAVAASLDRPVAEGQEPLARAYFREEYALNHRIHHDGSRHPGRGPRRRRGGVASLPRPRRQSWPSSARYDAR